MNQSKIYNIDARKLGDVIKSPLIDTTITSPPYFDLKDYGSKNQIGLNQSYPDYLQDLKKVFSSVFQTTKSNGTLWIILDTFRKNGEVIPLPFDVAKILKDIGWKLQDIIIWSKERTLPWAHKGQSRSVFEYVLFFSKSDKFKYYVDKIRDYRDIKKWWIKYPERYNPLGKNLEEIWRFDIPTQGSWGNGYVKHFCPLPEGLVQRIITLTTDECDVVLDPFAGSGTVPAQAKFMNRRYIGIELNKSYIKLFKSYLIKKGAELKHNNHKKNNIDQGKFRRLVINLRVLKYARILKKQLIKSRFKIGKILIIKSSEKPNIKNKLVVANYTIVLGNKTKLKSLEKKVAEYITKPPLSKFGVMPIFRYVSNENSLLIKKSASKLFVYNDKATNYYLSSLKEATLSKKEWSYLSDIKIRIKEKDWEETSLG
jgi:DNA modification methylase